MTDTKVRTPVDCPDCGHAHLVSIEWCRAMSRELENARNKSVNAKAKRSNGNVIGQGSPATGLIERHSDPITLRKAANEPASAYRYTWSDKQIKWINDMVALVPADVRDQWSERVQRAIAEGAKPQTIIDPLKAVAYAPKPVQKFDNSFLTTVPHGSYALDSVDGSGIVFYDVRVSRSGYVRAFHQFGPNYESVPFGQLRALFERIVAAGVKDSAARYGRELGECGRCHRKLTSEYRHIGIGPECIKKY